MEKGSKFCLGIIKCYPKGTLTEYRMIPIEKRNLLVAKNNVFRIFPSMDPKKFTKLFNAGEGPKGYEIGKVRFFELTELTEWYLDNNCYLH